MFRGYSEIIEKLSLNRCNIYMCWYSRQIQRIGFIHWRPFGEDLLNFIPKCVRFHRQFKGIWKWITFRLLKSLPKENEYGDPIVSRFEIITFFQGYIISKKKRNSTTTGIFFMLTKVLFQWEMRSMICSFWVILAPVLLQIVLSLGKTAPGRYLINISRRRTRIPLSNLKFSCPWHSTVKDIDIFSIRHLTPELRCQMWPIVE